jgi:hypothetical protein
LDEKQSAEWQKKLAEVGGQRSEAGGRWKVQCSKSGAWTLVGLTEAPKTGNTETPVFTALVARIQRDQAPFPARATNYWLEANLDADALCPPSSVLRLLSPSLPRVALTFIGEGDHTRTRATLDFPKPLSLELEPWNVPTKLVASPLASFTALRGFGPWLASLPLWQDLHLGSPPDQLYAWALPTHPMFSYLAAPDAGASNQVARFADFVVRNQTNHWFATHGNAAFAKTEGPLVGLGWKGVPFYTPFLKTTLSNQGPFILAGLGPDPEPASPPPGALLDQVTGPAGLVYYDWEVTATRAELLHAQLQFARLVCKKAQMEGQMPSRAWLVAAEPQLANCITVGTKTGPAQLSLVRKSTIGFSALELSLLSDWLESPTFPHGLHTFVAPEPEE